MSTSGGASGARSTLSAIGETRGTQEVMASPWEHPAIVEHVAQDPSTTPSSTGQVFPRESWSLVEDQSLMVQTDMDWSPLGRNTVHDASALDVLYMGSMGL